MNEPDERLRPRGLYVPLELFDDDRMSHTEKFLVVTVDMLDNGERHCYASNAYLAQRLHITEQSVANALSKLRGLAWVVDKPKGDDNRRLTTPLRGFREQIRALRLNDRLTNLSTVPYSNEEDPLTNLSTSYNIGRNSGDELEKREELLLQIFKQGFPDYTPSPFQQDQIYTTVTDVESWQASVTYWAGNGHQPRSVAKLLDLYERTAEEKANPTTTLSPTLVVVEDGCPFCTGPMPEKCPAHGGQNG